MLYIRCEVTTASVGGEQQECLWHSCFKRSFDPGIFCLKEYQCILRQVLCSCFLRHRIYRTYCKYRCGHLPGFCCRGSLLQFPGQGHMHTVHPSPVSGGSSHAVIDVSCSRNTLRNIRCVSCDLGSDDTLLGILHIRQSQVFSRCNIAKESSTVHSGNCTSDCCSDMVISRSNVGYKRTKYIKRSTHADTLLYFHVGGNLIQRHMTRTFYHNLYIVIPCTFCQFSETNQFFNLTYIGCIGKASRTHASPREMVTSYSSQISRISS